MNCSLLPYSDNVCVICTDPFRVLDRLHETVSDFKLEPYHPIQLRKQFPKMRFLDLLEPCYSAIVRFLKRAIYIHRNMNRQMVYIECSENHSSRVPMSERVRMQFSTLYFCCPVSQLHIARRQAL